MKLTSKPFVLLGATFAILAFFQLLLVFGAPLGHAAWGGQHEVLPTNLRIASVFSIVIYALIFIVVRKRLQQPSSKFARIAAWIITIYFALGVVLNLASSSIWEKTIWAPVALVMSWVSWRIARSKSA